MRWLPSYLARGLVALIRARRTFDRLEARDILARNAKAASMPPRPSLPPADTALLERIAFAIPRLSTRLPWRSDCVIQAIAAQDWLAAHGLPSEIRIGVERPVDAPFGAHAWLVHDGRIVTGGDISRYDLLLAKNDGKP